MHCGRIGHSTYTGMVFIRQEVAVGYRFKQDEELPVWHTHISKI